MLTKQRDCGEQRERGENEPGETSKGFFGPGYRDNRHLHAISFLHHIKRGRGEGGREGRREGRERERGRSRVCTQSARSPLIIDSLLLHPSHTDPKILSGSPSSPSALPFHSAQS